MQLAKAALPWWRPQGRCERSGQTQSDTHYAYAAELEKALENGLTLTLHDGGTMTYAQAKAAGSLPSPTTAVPTAPAAR